MTPKTRTTPPSFPADWAVNAIIGRRAEQQDSVWAGPTQLANGSTALLLLVADGMGGATGGRLASTIAIETFRQHFEASQNVESVKARLQEALDAANNALADAIAQKPALKGMGTTFIGAVIHGEEIIWISVGDSLLLKSYNNRVERLNEDHSLAAVLDLAAERGEITRAQAIASNQRNVLRSALIGGTIAMIDAGAATIDKTSWIIAASDGVLTLPNSRIASLASSAKDSATLASAILSSINNDMPNDQDNVSLAIARIFTGSSRSAGSPLWMVASLGLGIGLAIVAAGLTLSLLWQPDGRENAKNIPPAASPSDPTTGTTPGVGRIIDDGTSDPPITLPPTGGKTATSPPYDAPKESQNPPMPSPSPALSAKASPTATPTPAPSGKTSHGDGEDDRGAYPTPGPTSTPTPAPSSTSTTTVTNHFVDPL